MGYTNFKQQYTYGFGVIDLHDYIFASSSTKFYLGEAFGAKANLSASTNDSTNTKPIDLKADKQMFEMKARLDIECLKDFAPIGTKEVFTLTPTVTTAGAGTVTWKFQGVDQTAVELLDTDDTSDKVVAKLVSAFKCNGWTAKANTSTHKMEITRDISAANIAKDDTKESATYTKSGDSGTITLTFAVGTQGVAPSADTHYIKLDIMSVSNATELTAYIGGGSLTPVATVYVTPQMMVAQSKPVFEITMPSNLKALTWIEMSMPNGSSTNLTAGKLCAHFNPNL